MFTGIVEDLGTVREVQRGPLSARLLIGTHLRTDEISLGESIAVDGACLTVAAHDAESFEVDASAETLARTSLGDRQVGEAVHLERALRLSDRLGGHLVSGH